VKLLARASAGLWLWAFGFCLLYALHGLGCARGWNGLPLPGGTVFGWIMIVTWLLLAGGAAVTLWWANRSPPGLERRLGVASAVAGLVGILVAGSPVLATSACL